MTGVYPFMVYAVLGAEQDVREEKLLGWEQASLGPGGVCSSHTTRFTPGAQKMSVQQLIPEY